MKTLLNNLVTVRTRKGFEVTGTVTKHVQGNENNGIVYVNDGRDTFKFFEGIDTITVLEGAAAHIAQLENFLLENFKNDFEGYGDEDEMTYVIPGFNYEVWASANEFGFVIMTANYDRRVRLAERDGDTERAYANEKSYKTIRGARQCIERYVNA